MRINTETFSMAGEIAFDRERAELIGQALAGAHKYPLITAISCWAACYLSMVARISGSPFDFVVRGHLVGRLRPNSPSLVVTSPSTIVCVEIELCGA